jgi:DNA polymerase III delta subunit
VILHVSGPSNAGPGERDLMLAKARDFLAEAGVDEVVRVDVPGRGGGEQGSGALRAEIEAAIPVLQSASLFGGVSGLQIADANQLTADEATVLAELVETMDPSAVALVVVSSGAVPAALAKVLKARGEVAPVKKMRERDSQSWLVDEVRSRGLSIDGAAVEALIQRFGTDTASIGQALDQLAEVSEKITANLIKDRFRNRPNEPTWLYTDAVTKGNAGEALRRLGDLLTHTHPLVLLGALESEVRRRALALSSSDVEEFRETMGARSNDRSVEFLWRNRAKVKDSSLRQAVDALVRADRILKSAPEPMHRITMERLTVAMSRWMAGR